MKNQSTYRLSYFVKTCLKNVAKSSVEHAIFSDTLPLPVLNESEMLLFEGTPTKKELHPTMMSMSKKTDL